MHTAKLLLSIASLSALSTAASAAHWTFQSWSQGTYITGSGATHGKASEVQATISGQVYGNGSFDFVGETDTYGEGGEMTYPFLNNYQGTVTSYYTVVYVWAADSPTDQPPTNGPLAVDGYSLEAVPAASIMTPDVGDYESGGSVDALFDAQGPTFPVQSGYFTMPLEYAVITGVPWPTTNTPPVTTIGGKLYYVRPVVVGSAVISKNGSGQTIGTVTVDNSQELSFVGPTITQGAGDPPTGSISNSGTTSCFIGGSIIGGLPVTGG